MKFGPITTSKAAGAILVHTAHLAGRVLKKGHLLRADDIKLFAEEGISEIIVARLEPEDIPENEAASQIATALTGKNLDPSIASTGRCNLISRSHGLIILDPNTINKINLVDESVTIATALPFDKIDEGQLVATIKIIPFAITKEILDSVIKLASNGSLISIAPFTTKDVGLIMTRLPGIKESILDKTYRTITNRLAEFGSNVVNEIRCNHSEINVTGAIEELKKCSCDIILILGASAVVDRSDVLPAAVIQAGGHIEHFGMPVDPGNLLFLGNIGKTPIIGMPGCARSPKINGFDWILWRILANISINSRDIMLMGSGGLLKEINERGQLRQPINTGSSSVRKTKIIALLLAAGSSSRMGKENKLLSNINGTAMIVRVAEQIKLSRAHSIYVVTGHQAKHIQLALKNFGTSFHHNTQHAAGLSTSIKTGLEALSSDVDGVIICLGDMPLVKAHHLDQIIESFKPTEGQSICVPVYGRKRGNPILWGKQYIKEILAISGDMGARLLLENHADQIIEVPIESDSVVFDIDTPERLIEVKKRIQQ
jgi:molybdenum cofactor cytidylyltransferase